ncbi:MAG: alanine--glyoxylate aminotransferase family protein [Chloroflexota bacterium]|nr:alanine--glyoxylate aminotransferase family protein [Chloroflexota bacterium]MDQ5866908.1 alanine--glyoxylate aminotransferase family protein [Chloroflexota bacterium]
MLEATDGATDRVTIPPHASPPKRLLMGPGPSEVDPEVLRSLLLPPLGHLDPALLQIMQELEDMLRAVFGTRNQVTLAISGTGTAGMEAALANTVEPGAHVVVGVMGYFGDRLCQIAARLGGVVTRVEGEWGKPLYVEQMWEAIQRVRPGVVCAVHAETSTGVRQDLADIASAAHEVDALFVVDAVTSLGGQPLLVDEWGIDVCYSGSQKCLGAPSGLAPFTINERALERAARRDRPVPTFYLDAALLHRYWDERQYHHTISAPLIYALHTALRLLHTEGLEHRWERHRRSHLAFRAGVEAMGLGFLPDEEWSLWPLNAILLPEGLDELELRSHLLNRHGIEVGGGLGPLKGKLLRVGLMGYGAQQGFVLHLLGALEETLRSFGLSMPAGAGVAAALGQNI